jgi:hypothetical protein
MRGGTHNGERSGGFPPKDGDGLDGVSIAGPNNTDRMQQ